MQKSEKCQDWNQSVFLSSKVALRGFGHIEQKEDIYWLNHCMMMEVDFTCLMKSWWYYVKEDLKSLGLSQQDAQPRNKQREINGDTRLPIKTMTMYVCVLIKMVKATSEQKKMACRQLLLKQLQLCIHSTNKTQNNAKLQHVCHKMT